MTSVASVHGLGAVYIPVYVCLLSGVVGAASAAPAAGLGVAASVLRRPEGAVHQSTVPGAGRPLRRPLPGTPVCAHRRLPAPAVDPGLLPLGATPAQSPRGPAGGAGSGAPSGVPAAGADSTRGDARGRGQGAPQTAAAAASAGAARFSGAVRGGRGRGGAVPPAGGQLGVCEHSAAGEYRYHAG